MDFAGRGGRAVPDDRLVHPVPAAARGRGAALSAGGRAARVTRQLRAGRHAPAGGDARADHPRTAGRIAGHAAACIMRGALPRPSADASRPSGRHQLEAEPFAERGGRARERRQREARVGFVEQTVERARLVFIRAAIAVFVMCCAFISCPICHAITRLIAVAVAASRLSSSSRKVSKSLPICGLFVVVMGTPVHGVAGGLSVEDGAFRRNREFRWRASALSGARR